MLNIGEKQAARSPPSTAAATSSPTGLAEVAHTRNTDPRLTHQKTSTWRGQPLRRHCSSVPPAVATVLVTTTQTAPHPCSIQRRRPLPARTTGRPVTSQHITSPRMHASSFPLLVPDTLLLAWNEVVVKSQFFSPLRCCACAHVCGGMYVRMVRKIAQYGGEKGNNVCAEAKSLSEM